MSDERVFINPDEPVTMIESFCPSCEGQGMTRLLLCSIPFFKDIVVMSFSCDNCGYKNNEVQSAGSLAEKGIKITLKVNDSELLNREVLKSEWAVITIPEIELEIPATTQKATFTTVEGILTKVYEELLALQPERRVTDPVTAQKIDDFLDKISLLRQGKEFTIVLYDPSGNSYISHDFVKYKLAVNDPSIKIEHFYRTRDQMITMGYIAEGQDTEETKEIEENKADLEEINDKIENQHIGDKKISAQNHDFSQSIESSHNNEEVIEMPSRCFACYKPGTVKMCMTNLPHFKETVIMAFNCDFCGAKSNEVKPGGGISEKARKITLLVKNPGDLSRFIIKSDVASIHIPEIGLELSSGTLGAQVSTLEGILGTVYEELDKNIGFAIGDSQETEERKKFRSFMDSLKQMRHGLYPEYSFVLDDPLSNSYVSGIGEGDHQIVVEDYFRTEVQNEELGITDMKTENYE